MSNATSNSWVWREIGDYIHVGRGFAFKSEQYRAVGVPIVRVTNISADGNISLNEDVVFIDENEAREYSEYKLALGDVLLVMVGATVGKLGLVKETVEGALLNQNMWRLVIRDRENNSQTFAYYAIQRVVDGFLSKQQGSASGFLTQKGFSSEEILLPPKVEQQKIASILNAVDEVIESTQTQINKLKDLKTGMMQELLTKGIGHTEFKDSPVGRIPKAWDCITVGELLQNGAILAIQDGNHGEKHPKSSDFVNDGIPFVMASDIRDGRLSTESANKISEEVYNGLRIGFAKPGDVLLTHKATVGQTAIVPESVKRLMLTPQVTYYRIKEDGSLLNEFLYFFFQSQCFQDAISIFSAQSTRSYIGIKAQQELQVLLPDSVSEQLAIVGILKALDNKLQNADRKLNRIERLKKGLMQDLLTGKVRVIKSDDEQ